MERFLQKEDFVEEIYHRIARLCPVRRLAVPVAVAERMYPLFAAYARDTLGGDDAFFRRGLDLLRQAVAGVEVGSDSVQAIYAECLKRAPNLDVEFVPEALYAASALGNAISCFCEDYCPQRACGAVDNLLDAAQSMVTYDTGMQAWTNTVWKSSPFCEEISWTKSLLDFLERANFQTNTDVVELFKFSQSKTGLRVIS